MKAAAFAFVRVTDIDAALSLLSDGGFSKPMAGGQSLGPMLNLRLAQPDRVVAVTSLPAMREVVLGEGSLFLGAAVTHAQIEDGAVPDVTGGMLARVASNIAYRAVRNRGTIGGSLVHADPAADWISTMLAVGATMMIAGPQGQREVAAEQWMTAPFTTALAENELLLGLRIPRFSGAARWGYDKFCRKTGEFAEAIGAVVIDPPRGVFRMVIGATDGAPCLLTADSEADIAARWSEAALRARLETIGMGDDAYAMQMHLTAARRALAQAQA